MTERLKSCQPRSKLATKKTQTILTLSKLDGDVDVGVDVGTFGTVSAGGFHTANGTATKFNTGIDSQSGWCIGGTKDTHLCATCTVTTQRITAHTPGGALTAG